MGNYNIIYLFSTISLHYFQPLCLFYLFISPLLLNLGSVWEFIKEWNEWNGMIIKGMEWNGIEWNGFSKERNGMECDLKILFGCYKIKEWNGMESK